MKETEEIIEDVEEDDTNYVLEVFVVFPLAIICIFLFLGFLFCLISPIVRWLTLDSTLIGAYKDVGLYFIVVFQNIF